MRRDESVARLDRLYDLLVIGGGATGLGVALDSASRGYATLLVEARDFAQGTSSRSTKLVHGGVRYLQQGDIGLVREALHERGRLLRNAPHLVHELRFLVPAYRWWHKPWYGTGLKLYDLLAGRLKLSRARVVDAETAIGMVPTIEREGLRGGVVYSDAQFNDARLAISIARTADALGATLLNYAPVRALLHEDGRVAGAVIVDAESGREHAVRARGVVNATGVFTDAIRRMDDAAAPAVIAASQGIHLMLDRSFLPGETAILVPRTADGRVVFIIPWQGRTLVGTTDTPVPAPSVEPTALEGEIAFVLRHAGLYLTRKPTRADVLAVYAGLRPLVRGKDSYDNQGDSGEATAKLGRDHTLLESASGLVTITGGKWTTYRRMAEETVDRAAAVAGLPARPCRTRGLRLWGAASRNPRWIELGATEAEVAEYEALFAGPLHPRLPYSLAMAAYVIDHEMPVRLEDVLSRRLRALLLDARAAVEAAPRTAELMAALQGRDDAWVRAELDAFRRLAEEHYLVGAEVAGTLAP
ncbi:MAG: glycerol-3-phosphate dehydrogenase/oxidase [Chloroflexota bacterium]|nr:glycerol-3-phosphate dehydrogenase/oxidase [Chloroflexota bacterium]